MNEVALLAIGAVLGGGITQLHEALRNRQTRIGLATAVLYELKWLDGRVRAFAAMYSEIHYDPFQCPALDLALHNVHLFSSNVIIAMQRLKMLLDDLRAANTVW